MTATATELYRVRSYEVDAGGLLAATALCNYLQESAGLHARQLGVGIEQLLPQGMTWFLWRLHLRIEHLPAWGETVTVETWPSAISRPFVLRDFRLTCGSGQAVGVATSAWLLMDTVRKQPITRLPPHIRDLHGDPPRRALVDDLRRLPALADSATCEQQVLRVRRGDLDLNRHLNNVAAIRLLLEAVPAEILDGSRLAELKIELKAEGHLGDELTSRCQHEGDGLLHALARPADGKELARARSRWTLSS